jgi:hypothetical protein
MDSEWSNVLTCKPPVDLYLFFEISIRTEKKNQLELKKKISYKLTEIFFSVQDLELRKNFSEFITEIFFQFEINAEMDMYFKKSVEINRG